LPERNFRGVGEEDLAERTPGLLARVALNHFEFGSKRTPGQSLVRVFNPDPERDGFDSPHTLVMAVTDDMPFLVDSLSIVFKRAELAVHLIVHPVLDVRRDGRGRIVEAGANGNGNGNGTHTPQRSESWQLYEIDRQNDPAQIEEDPTRHRGHSSRRPARPSPTGPRCASGPAWSSACSKIPRNRLPRMTWPRRATCSVGWKLGLRISRLPPLHTRARRAEDRLVPDPRSGLGVLRDGKRKRKGSGATVLRGDIRAKAREPELLILTKANSTSTVHRDEYLDYVGVKTFDARGKVTGEHRFLGLWTSTAYHGSPRDIPVLRRKVEACGCSTSASTRRVTTARLC